MQTLRFQRTLPMASLLVAGTLVATLAACGGGGYGGSTGMGAGCGAGPYGGSTCPAPTIMLSSPGATVSRTVTLTATAASGAAVMRVEFMVDGASVGTATAAPYKVSWDSTTVSDGTHTLAASVTDNLGQTTKSAAIAITVHNDYTFNIVVQPGEVFPMQTTPPGTSGFGNATLVVNMATGAASGKLVFQQGASSATAVSVNEAFAGTAGPMVISLVPSPSTTLEWDIPAGTVLTADLLTALLQGKLYVIADSAASPGGFIRGQFLPPNVTLIYANLLGSQEVPPLTTTASGVAATTVDTVANTVTVHVQSMGVDDATAAAVDTGAAGASGPKLVGLAKDSANMGHWSVELAPVATADLANFKANKWYVNLVTPADPDGALRGQIDATSP